MRRLAKAMKVVITIVAVGLMLTACGGNDEHHFETYPDISVSAVHGDTLLVTVRPDEVEETTDDSSADYSDSDDDAVPDDGGLTEESTEWTISRQAIIDKAYELYGVSEEWTMWLIGTTWNEGYQGDRYLEYAWACAVINEYRYWSVWDLDCIWGSYYSIGNAYSGYYAADDWTLSDVYEALVNRDTRIVECDGMITYPPAGYYLIYDSEIYNCQVWGN